MSRMIILVVRKALKGHRLLVGIDDHSNSLTVRVGLGRTSLLAGSLESIAFELRVLLVAE